MSKDVLDMKRQAVDRVAARVIGKGEHWRPEINSAQGDSDLPLPIIPLKNISAQDVRQTVIGMIGRKRGRLTIVGMAECQATSKNKGIRYVVRCVCGIYTYRRGTPFKKSVDGFDACERCRALITLKRKEIWRRGGKEPSWQEICNDQA